ncbi:hypothetical protein ACK30V_18650, partial [Aeromonas caviae]
PRNPSRSKKRLLKTALRDNYLEKRRRWLAQAVVSYYRPAAPAPSLFSFSTKLDEEAQGMFFQMLLIRSKPDWSDDQLAALVRECEQYLAN